MRGALVYNPYAYLFMRRLIVVLILLPLLAACVPERPRHVHAPVNVLFIVADDLRPLVSAYGAAGIHTPHIDRLAESGFIFRRAYVQQAWCSPSRTSVLTGLRPDRTRVYDLVTHFRTTAPEAVTLPQYFRKHGYFTAAVGKVFHRGLDDARSWSVPTWEPAVDDPLKHYVLPENMALLSVAKRGYATPTEAADVPDEVYPDGQITSRAIELLSTRGNQPFFLAVGFYKPHLPFNAPRRYWDLDAPDDVDVPAAQGPPVGAPPYAFLKWAEHTNYTGVPQRPNGTSQPDSIARSLIHGYYACVSYIDAQVGRLLDALEREGLADNTIVVFWGDHGWKLGEYDTWSKHTNYEVDTRVPLIIRSPHRPGGTGSDAVVELLDLYPTLVEMAGLPAAEGVQGVSLVPLIEGQPMPAKTAAYSQFIRNEERTYTTYAEAVMMGQAVRTERYRLVRWIDRAGAQQALELYDHRHDPHETVNVAAEGQYQATVQQLRETLDHTFDAPFPRHQRVP